MIFQTRPKKVLGSLGKWNNKPSQCPILHHVGMFETSVSRCQQALGNLHAEIRMANQAPCTNNNITRPQVIHQHQLHHVWYFNPFLFVKKPYIWCINSTPSTDQVTAPQWRVLFFGCWLFERRLRGRRPHESRFRTVQVWIMGKGAKAAGPPGLKGFHHQKTLVDVALFTSMYQ